MTSYCPARLTPLAALLLPLFTLPAQAADAPAAELPAVVISDTPSAATRLQAPNSNEGRTRDELAQTVNAVNTEDSFKYLPNVLVRKRFIGDTDAPIASRTTGINASARSLVYADGVLLTPLINNNNGNGSPRWFMVSPQEIERIDVLYGPYSAAYPGNSYGLVADISTRMPQKLEAGIKLTGSQQQFDQYGTHDNFRAGQGSAYFGNRSGNWSYWLSASHLDSFSQPVTYANLARSSTASSAATPVISGVLADRNRTGGDIVVLGAGNLTHTVQDNAKLKLAYDVTPTLQAAYTLGFWQNSAGTAADSYLRDANGNPYYGGNSGNVSLNGRVYSASSIAGQFSAGSKDALHVMQSLTLSDKGAGNIGWNVALANYDYATHKERSSTVTPYTSAQQGGAGRILDMGGTGWTTLDASASWKSSDNVHRVRGGVHYDRYTLASPTWNTSDWRSDSTTTLFSDARGKSSTAALWLQDAWRWHPDITATLGLRYENWRAFDGANSLTNSAGKLVTVQQPGRSDDAVSPKLSIAWSATPDWLITGSLGRAVRFPTVGELYQTIQVGSTYQSADPNLKPETVTSGELAFERAFDNGKLRISLFEEHVRDALISQTAQYPGVAAPTSFMQNVDATRQRGIEIVADQRDAFIAGLDLSGSITYVDARITANDRYVPSMAGATSVGKRTPYIPDWRATAVATYRPNERWSFTLAGRYSGTQYATVDNTDTNAHTYMGFESFFVLDTRVQYRLDKQWTAAVGIDNINNRDYYLYHPFPQRTYYAELKFDL
ncbi:iron complex outermembrane recepter protein [Andreprevotia lacus DSM 23236]|uniref:Iron complex outermembrane recepter protein n=2 Tax=Andreprevotia TaxID=397275 RepID=A0A1W1XLF0_9NEIS|nr:iron complex outermembrane recepter protein [Andreprevotia lacus DSM 23236]